LIRPAWASHVAQALGHRACRAGHFIIDASGHDLLGQYCAGRGDGSLDHKMLPPDHRSTLVIADLGLRPFNQDKPVDSIGSFDSAIAHLEPTELSGLVIERNRVGHLEVTTDARGRVAHALYGVVGPQRDCDVLPA
jgi:IstB-like ATP binding protein